MKSSVETVHCERCGNDFKTVVTHEDPLTQEEKDSLFEICPCPFCPTISKAEEKFVREHTHPHIEPYKERGAKG
jgi:hypothetical protein